MSCCKWSKIYLFFLVFTYLGMGSAYAQTAIPREDLSSQDKDQLKQIARLNVEATEFFEEAEDLREEIEKLKEDQNLTGDSERIKELKSKVRQAERKGFKNRFRANSMLFEIYETYLDTIVSPDSTGKDTTLIKALLKREMAEELFFRSGWLKSSSDSVSDHPEARIDRLQQAMEYERLALKRFDEATLYLRSTGEDSLNAGGLNQGEEMVIVNKSLLSDLYRILNRIDPGKKRFERFWNLRINDTLYMAQLRGLWNAYRNNEQAPEIPEIEEAKQTDSTEADSSGFRLENKTYRVQVAADTGLISRDSLKKLYSGEKAYLKAAEENWHKYFIGDFNTFSKAHRFRKDMPFGDAFIVAHPENKKNLTRVFGALAGKTEKEQEIKPEEEPDIQPGEESGKETAKKAERRSQGETALAGDKKVRQASAEADTTGVRRLAGDVIYRVQIASDRVRLGPSKLDSIYPGVKKIFENRGEGWYRYSIGNCPTYYHARKLKNHTPVRGDWVVAYKNNKRLNAYNMKTRPDVCPPLTIRRNDEVPGDGPVFRVQIAASTNRISEEALKYIYCGNRDIFEVRDGRFYTYSVGSFSRYEDAAALKRSICVPGAFVVAFRNGRPVDVGSVINAQK